MIERENMSKVGQTISNLRQERGMDVDTLASILLLRPEHLVKIEAGELIPEEGTMNLISNIFGVRKMALEVGRISRIDHDLSPNNGLFDLENSIKALIDQTWRLLDELQDLRGMERYRAESFAFDLRYYVIRDNVTGELLANENGIVYEYSDVNQALATATRLEQGELIPEQLQYFDEFQTEDYTVTNELDNEVEPCQNTETMHI